MPRIVLIGSTNVGKSSLVNALLGRGASVVGGVENLTNDVVNHYKGDFVITDTPGITYQNCFELIDSILGADLFLATFDNSFDQELCNKILRKIPRDSLALVINKQDCLKEEPVLPNVKTFIVSCKTGFGLLKLKKHVFSCQSPVSEPSKSKPSISVLGRSNVGKSTLVNAIIGHQRFRVKDEIGTTRDIAIEKLDLIDIIDTPGYRKLKSEELGRLVQKKIEEHIKERPFTVGVVVLDATQGFTSIDKFIIDKVINTGFVVVCLNKVDLISKTEADFIVSRVVKLFPTVEVFKIVANNDSELKDFTKKLYQKLKRLEVRLKTSAVNKAVNLEGELSDVKYITQTGPYSFKVFSHRQFSESKLRFMEKVLLRAMKLKGIRLKFEVCGR